MAKGENSASADKVLAKVAAIELKMEELKSATRTAVWVGRLVLLVVAVVIILQVLSVINIFRNIDKEAYAKAAQEELVALIPKGGAEAGNLAENLAPVYQEALFKEFDKSMPEIAETFTREMDLLIKNVGEFVNRSLEEKFNKMLEKQLGVLAADMPELKDSAKRKEIMDGTLDVAHTASLKLANELFKPQIEVLSDLSATLDSASIPDNIAKMNDTQLVHYAAQRLGDLLLLKLVVFEDVFAEAGKPSAPMAQAADKKIPEGK